MDSSRTEFCIELAKECHTFSAAHFITFNRNVCESLHGHNYRVKCEVHGALDENGYVVDFIALRDRLSAIISELDHRMLLPTLHPAIRVRDDDREVTVTYEDRRWVFPKQDCVLLPISNTTAELLAQHIGTKLINDNPSLFPSGIHSIKLMVDENHGQWAAATLKVHGTDCQAGKNQARI